MNESGTNRYKIGHTKNSVSSRIRGLQTGNSDKIIEVYTFESDFATKIEHSLHNLYSINNVNGEWFEFSQDQLNQVIELIDQMNYNFNFLKNNQI